MKKLILLLLPSLLLLNSCKKEDDNNVENFFILSSLSGSLSTPCIWTQRTSQLTSSVTSIRYLNNNFVALSGSQIATSPDGITWTQRTSPSTDSFSFYYASAYGNGTYVLIRSNGTFATSTDGITWISRAVGLNKSWNDGAFGNGLFVAINGGTSTDSVMTSPDGIIWTTRTTPTGRWNSLTYENGLFVAVGTGVMTSTDGITWTARTSPSQSSSSDLWVGPVYGNGKFVALNGNAQAITSPDGITWTILATNNNRVGAYDLAFGGGSFIAVAGTPQNLKSTDGTNWTFGPYGSSPVQRNITFANDLFVAGGVSGEIFTSTCTK